MDKKKIALIVVVLFLLIGLGSFVFANPDQDENLEGPGVSEDGGSGDGEVIDGTEPTATPEEENDDSATETDPITTYGNGGNGTGTGAGNNGTTGGVGNTDMSQYDDARRIIEELENRVNSMQNKDDSNAAVDYRTDTDIIDMVNNLPDGTVKDELKDRLDAINKVLDDTKAPVITGINNNDVTKENVTINVTDDNDVTITATLDGEEIEFTTPLTEEGHYVVTVTDKNFNTTTVEFTIDKTPIALDWLYVLNNSGTDYKVIGDGQKLYVELVFSEEFTSTPMIQIGNAEAVEMSCHWTNWQTEKQYFKCDATITIDGSTMGLENGKEVPVKITNVLDAAGNETVLTNENITETEKYGHVIYDNQAPKMEVLRLTNVSRKDENGAWLQVAKAGDIVRVIVQFNENLATLPTLKVNGTEVGVMKYDSNMQSYTYDYKVTENDVNGVMQIEISNYADAAGNVGVTLTNDDINHETQNQVVIDTVAPEYAAMGIFNWTNDNDGTDRTYATKNEHIRLYVSFPEMLATNPKVDIYGMDGKVTTLDLSYSEAAKFYFVEFDTTDEFALPEGKINFKVYGYADEAGNVGADLTQDMTTSNEYPQVIYDSINPVLEGLTDGMYTNQTISLKISDTNWDYIHVNQVGVKEFDEHREWTGLYDDGVYEFQAFDKAGNCSEIITVTKDSVVPVQTQLLFHSSNANNNQLAKPGDYFGVYLTVNEELRENPTFVINGVEYQANQFYHADGVHQYSAVYEIPANTPAGEMTFTISNIVDKAGNVMADVTNENADEGVNTIVYDNVSPGPRVVGITGFFNEAEGADAHYITTGESVRILTYYDEKLGTAPMVKIGNKEFQTYYAEQSSSEENGSYAYYADIKITEDLGLSDGEIQFSIYGHKDAAGNEGRAYTNADVTYTESSPYEIRYDKVILDNIAPEFNVTSGTHGETSMDITITDVNFDYAVVVNQDNGVSENVYEKEFTLQQEATYHIYAYDKAGNVADLWVAIDNENPTVTVSGTGVDGYYRSDVRIQAFDKFLTSVKVNEDTVDRSSFTSDGRNENFSYETTVSEEGTYTVTATDKYGHSTEYTFVIDKTMPVVQGAVDGGLYNAPVTLTVIEENIQNAKYQKDGGDWVSFESGTVLDQDGTYFVRVTDKAYNKKAELTFTIDQTDPVVKSANILVDGDVNEQTEFYATTGDTIYSYVRFSEELKQNPKFYLVNNGTEYEVSDVTVTGPNDNGEYTYSIRYTITEDNTMIDGQIEMKVTGISDKAGNTIDDITKPTNGHIVYLDRIAPTATAFRMVGGNRETENGTYMYATNGAKIYIYAEFANKLAVSPKALINDSIEVSFDDGTLRGDRYIYSAIYTVQENDGLQDGELQVKVYGYADEAGNVGKELSNEDITLASQKYIIIDKTAPKLDINPLTDGYSNSKNLGVSGTDANKLNVVITNAGGNVVRADSSSQGSDGTYWTAYGIENEIGVDGQYTAVASDVAGNKTTVTFTVDREAPKFDLSAIPTTFTIGKDIYQYPQPGVVTDNIDGNISFGEVHMNWYHKNADGTKGESTQCFGGDNWNTSLTSCEPGDYIITYRVSDKAGNETSVEKTMTLVKEVVNEAPILDDVVTGGEYTGSITYDMYDKEGEAFTIYYDLSNGFTNADELVKYAKEHNQIVNVAAGERYNGVYTIPVTSKKVSVCLEDVSGNRTFLYNITINQ